MTKNEFNLHQICGRLTQDPKAIETAGGHFCLRFTLAYHTVRTADSDGSHANFIEIEYWGKGAKSYQPHLKKGLQVVVHGELVQKRWVGKDGKKREKFVLVAQALTISDLNYRLTQVA